MTVNSEIPWFFVDSTLPPSEKEIYILVEEDCEDKNLYPYTRKAMLIENNIDSFPRYLWKLLDYVPEAEDEILNQYFTVIAWRPM